MGLEVGSGIDAKARAPNELGLPPRAPPQNELRNWSSTPTRDVYGTDKKPPAAGLLDDEVRSLLRQATDGKELDQLIRERFEATKGKLWWWNRSKFQAFHDQIQQ